MKKFFAITKSDNSYIVSAESKEELLTQIEEIRKEHPEYYRDNIAPGYYIVEAKDIKQAKAAKSLPTYDLPLFKYNKKEEE